MSEWKKFVIEFGFGIDQHGQDPTHAAIKAVKDAISRCYLTGIMELGLKEMKIEALIGVPHSDKVDLEAVKKAFPLDYEKDVKVVEGGLVGEGFKYEELGDKNSEILLAAASITVFAK